MVYLVIGLGNPGKRYESTPGIMSASWWLEAGRRLENRVKTEEFQRVVG